MAKLRFVANEPHDVPLLERTVEPDEMVEVDDDVFASRVWPEAQWAVVSEKKPTAKDKE